MEVCNAVILVLCAVMALAFAQIPNELEDQLGKAIENTGIQGLEKFNQTQLPKPEDLEKTMKEKCAKQGHEEAAEKIKNSQDSLQECIQQHINVTKFKEELEEAKKTGSMDEVFAKYCKKWPDIFGCTKNITDNVRLCLNEKEQKAMNKSLEIISELQEFMCFKDGDRLAMFVAEGGAECIQEKKNQVQNCINATIGDNIPSADDISVTNLPNLSVLFSEEGCSDFDRIRTCVNDELEKCSDSTPANIVDAFLKFLRKRMPCTATALPVSSPAEADPNGASTISLISSLLLFSLFMINRF